MHVEVTPCAAALEGDDLREALEAVLGRDVGRLEGAGAQAVDARDVDDAAPAAVVHVGQALPDQPERRDEHEVEDEVEAVERELLDRAHVLDAGVVDEDVDLGRQVGEGVEVGEVGRDRRDARARRRGRRGPPRPGRRRAPWRPRPRGPGDARPDAARGAGDEGGAPGQVDGFVDRQGAALEAVRGVVACVVAGVGHAGRLGRARPGHLCGGPNTKPRIPCGPALTSAGPPGRATAAPWTFASGGSEPSPGRLEGADRGQDEPGSRPRAPSPRACTRSWEFRTPPRPSVPTGCSRRGPIQPWDGVRDATRPGAEPPQVAPPRDRRPRRRSRGGTGTTSATPSRRWSGPPPRRTASTSTSGRPTPARRGLPVMVWIQGGMFELSSTAAYDGSPFARDGVVCVVINWRPGAEGFLYLDDGDRQPRPPRPGGGPRVGSRQHRRLRRRPRQRHGVRGVGRGDEHRRACWPCPRADGPLPASDPPERRGAPRDRRPGRARDRPRPGRPARRGPDPRRRSPAPASRGCSPRRPQLKQDLLAHPDPERWGPDVVTSTMPWQPVVDGDVLPAPPIELHRRRVGRGRRRHRRDEHRRLEAVARRQRRDRRDHRRDPHRPGRDLRVPVPRGLRARRRRRPCRRTGSGIPQPGPATCWPRCRPTGGCGSPPFGSPRRTPSDAASAHVHVRVRLAVTGTRRGPRARGPLRLRHGPAGRAALRAAARTGPAAGAGADDALRVDLVRDDR